VRRDDGGDDLRRADHAQAGDIQQTAHVRTAPHLLLEQLESLLPQLLGVVDELAVELRSQPALGRKLCDQSVSLLLVQELRSVDRQATAPGEEAQLQLGPRRVFGERLMSAWT
jgi:hypothetical protein